MWELVKAGGWLMLPLALCSICTVAIVLERFIRLRRNLVLPKQILLSQSCDISKIIRTIEQDKRSEQSALGQIFTAGFMAKSQSGDFAQAQMQVRASVEISFLEKNINFLGTLSAAAPLLGLLGTVIGIIESFLMMDLGSSGNPTAMIPGISKALITTAAGMLVAIPALFAYRYFQRLVQDYVAELEQQSTLFHATLFYRNSADESTDEVLGDQK